MQNELRNQKNDNKQAVIPGCPTGQTRNPGFKKSTHRHQFFGTGWMNGHALSKVFFREDVALSCCAGNKQAVIPGRVKLEPGIQVLKNQRIVTSSSELVG